MATDKLADPQLAIGHWRAVLESVPGDEQASERLGRLAERVKDWGTQALVLEGQLAEAEGTEGEAEVLKRLGAVYSERLEDDEAATRVWRRLGRRCRPCPPSASPS